jgi:hypothetical protein
MTFSANSPQILGKPVLLLDIDGVISLFGFDPDVRPEGTWHNVEGIAHFLSSTAATHLQTLDDWFDSVWCSGWEEKADEHLPVMLGIPRYPHLSFERNASPTHAHWKLAAIEEHAGDRPLAWIDDGIDEACEAWAAERAAPTLLIRTDPAVGLTDDGVEELVRWAREL